MRIGIDLDHTILRQEDGKSEILFGFKAFVIGQRSNEHQIMVLCYTEGKSEEETRTLLSGHGFFTGSDDGGFGFSENDLVFVSSNEDMIGKIKALKLSHFIDTQPGLILRDDFPESVQPLILGEGLEIICRLKKVTYLRKIGKIQTFITNSSPNCDWPRNSSKITGI